MRRLLLFLVTAVFSVTCVWLLITHRAATIIKTSRFGDITVRGTKNTAGTLVIFIKGSPTIDGVAEDLIAGLISRGNVVAIITLDQILEKRPFGEKTECYEYAGELQRLSQVIQSEIKMNEISKAVLLAQDEKSSALTFGMHPYLFKDIYASFAVAPFVSPELTRQVCKTESIRENNDFSDPNSSDNIYSNFTLVKSPSESGRDRALMSCTLSNCPLMDSVRAQKTMHNHQLPVIEEVPQTRNSKFFVIFLSGDGGWASIDKKITEYLNKKGVPVIGIDCLRYFWREKPPEVLGDDINKLIRSYQNKLKINDVAVIGFSLGANMVPFIINRLSDDNKSHVKYISLLNPTILTQFEIHFTDWIPGNVPETGVPVIDEIKKMNIVPGSCIKGSEEESSLCDLDLPPTIKKFVFDGTHHYNGKYDLVSEELYRQFMSNIH